MHKFIQQPLFWCWLFVVIWGLHVIMTLLMQRWQGAVISLLALAGAVMVLSAINSRRQKNLYPHHQNEA